MSSGSPMSDAALLVALPTDVAAFEAFYRRYVRRVTAFAAQRCACAADVADVVAQTFVLLLGAAERYDPEKGDPAPFVLGITANVVRDLYRRRSRDRELVIRLTGRDLLDRDESEQIEAAIDAARTVTELDGALEAIPIGQRDVLRLVAAGHTPQQAACELGISPNAARIRLSRARRQMRARAPRRRTTTTTNEE